MSHESIPFDCPSCGKNYFVTPQAAGHRMRCPHCNEVVEVKPASITERMDIQQTREFVPGETIEGMDSEILEPADEAEAPPRYHEPEAPPIMTAPLARPVGRPPGPPEQPPPEKQPDARVPKRKLVPQESEMDMTPMVDCVFQLLIFFMLTASFAVQKSLLIPKPTVDEGVPLENPQENYDTVTVRIDPQGHYFISGGELGGNEQEASARVELIMQLKIAKNVSSGSIPNKVMVLAHGDAMHERVVEAIDAANDAAYEQVGLKTVEDDES
jgi:biopolymer transport protein ExbD